MRQGICNFLWEIFSTSFKNGVSKQFLVLANSVLFCGFSWNEALFIIITIIVRHYPKNPMTVLIRDYVQLICKHLPSQQKLVSHACTWCSQVNITKNVTLWLSSDHEARCRLTELETFERTMRLLKFQYINRWRLMIQGSIKETWWRGGHPKCRKVWIFEERGQVCWIHSQRRRHQVWPRENRVNSGYGCTTEREWRRQVSWNGEPVTEESLFPTWQKKHTSQGSSEHEERIPLGTDPARRLWEAKTGTNLNPSPCTVWSCQKINPVGRRFMLWTRRNAPTRTIKWSKKTISLCVKIHD